MRRLLCVRAVLAVCSNRSHFFDEPLYLLFTVWPGCHLALCCSFELIRQNQFRGLSLKLVRLFTKQLLDSLIVLREARVIHCDLKPENVLLKRYAMPGCTVQASDTVLYTATLRPWHRCAIPLNEKISTQWMPDAVCGLLQCDGGHQAHRLWVSLHGEPHRLFLHPGTDPTVTRPPNVLPLLNTTLQHSTGCAVDASPACPGWSLSDGGSLSCTTGETQYSSTVSLC